jgi:ubiquinone/menaquinone biosynthesis C-methylase UbiE
VKAFLDVGCFATGIDLNPGKDNHYVLPGDFHHTQFASTSLDAVFTNSLDHAFDLETVLFEVRRLLKPRGIFVVELVDSASGGYYESTSWSSPDEVVRLLLEDGFTVTFRATFADPWAGEHVCLRAPTGRA